MYQQVPQRPVETQRKSCILTSEANHKSRARRGDNRVLSVMHWLMIVQDFLSSHSGLHAADLEADLLQMLRNSASTGCTYMRSRCLMRVKTTKAPQCQFLHEPECLLRCSR